MEYNVRMNTGYVSNIEADALANNDFRRVLFTSNNQQLVLMSLNPLEDIGEEVHTLDQFFRCEKGTGKAVINGVDHPVSDGFVIMIPAGIKHNLVNTSETEPMKLYTLYSPPNHADGTVHHTKAEAEASDEHFDGKTTH
jgi:mannose-6-phosphate isomerase-like protein (cupin superfamily)